MISLGRRKSTHDVFGVSPEVLPDSYVDRGHLDAALKRLLGRKTHIALRGESKCGKPWLRRSVIPDALVVQCRLGKTMIDIYRDALSPLGIRLVVESKEGDKLTGRVEANAAAGVGLPCESGYSLDRRSHEREGRNLQPGRSRPP